MTVSRRGLICGGVAAAGLSFLPAYAQRPTGRPYGVIMLAVTGISVSVYRIDKRTLTGSARLSGYERLGLSWNNSSDTLAVNPLRPDADDAAVTAAAELVAQNIARMKSRYGIADDNIAILASSALVSYAGPIVSQLPARVRERTGLDLRLLTPREEAELQYEWIVPADQRSQALHLEISGADLKGGCYLREGSQLVYHDFSAPFGTRNFAGAVKLRWPSVRTDDFGARATELYQQSIAPVVKAQLDAAPEALHRPKIYLTGGIVWATAVILHPREMALQNNWTRLRADDFSTLLKLIEAGTPYGSGLPDTLTGAHRDWVIKRLGSIRNIFNPHQLAAGAAIGVGLAQQLDLAGAREISFPSFADGASSSQYLLNKITGKSISGSS